jgi:NADPH2:quinone reductase
VHAGADRHEVGDQVTALVIGGGYADYCVADERHALPIPTGCPWKKPPAFPKRPSRSGRTFLTGAG